MLCLLSPSIWVLVEGIVIVGDMLKSPFLISISRRPGGVSERLALLNPVSISSC